MEQSEQNNRIDYIELPVDRVEAAKAFYGRVFGWTFTDFGPHYASFRDGRLTGGLNGDPGEKPPPLVIMYARDLEATRNAVVSAGGRVRDDIFDFPGGRRFHFFDPAGMSSPSGQTGARRQLNMADFAAVVVCKEVRT